MKDTAVLAAMGEEHLDAVARTEALCFSRPWSREALASELENPCARFLVCLVGGAVAGYAGMHAVCKEGYIANVAVCPEFRRRGLGRLLVKGLLSAAEKEALEFMTLEVRVSNQAAIALYESEGFSRVGVRRGFYEAPKEDALLLTRYFPLKSSEELFSEA